MRISDWSSDVCSSDLHSRPRGLRRGDGAAEGGGARGVEGQRRKGVGRDLVRPRRSERRHRIHRLYVDRSEEHTSELQSLMRISYAVFCLQKKIVTKHSHSPLTM